MKKAKLEAIDKQRMIERDQAVLDLESNRRNMQEMCSKAENIRVKLGHVKVRPVSGIKQNLITQ